MQTWRDVAKKNKPRPLFRGTSKRPTINRVCLTRTEHMQVLSTPKGYRWTGARGLRYIARRCKDMPPTLRRRFDGKPNKPVEDIGLAWKCFVTHFLLRAEDSLNPATKIMLKKILVSKANFTDPKWSNRRNTQAELCHFLHDLNPDCSSCKWQRDSVKALSSLIFSYFVQVLCSNHIMKKNSLTNMILKIMNQISQEQVQNSSDKFSKKVKMFIANILSPLLKTDICQDNRDSKTKQSYKTSNRSQTIAAKENKRNKESKPGKLTKSKKDKSTISKKKKTTKSKNVDCTKIKNNKLTKSKKKKSTKPKTDVSIKSRKKGLKKSKIDNTSRAKIIKVHKYKSDGKIEHRVGKISVETKINDKEIPDQPNKITKSKKDKSTISKKNKTTKSKKDKSTISKKKKTTKSKKEKSKKPKTYVSTESLKKGLKKSKTNGLSREELIKVHEYESNEKMEDLVGKKSVETKISDKEIPDQPNEITESKIEDLIKSKNNLLTQSKNEMSTKSVMDESSWENITKITELVSYDKIESLVDKKSVETKINDKEFNRSKSTVREDNKITEPPNTTDSKFSNKINDNISELAYENKITKEGTESKSVDGNLRSSAEESLEVKNSSENDFETTESKSNELDGYDDVTNCFQILADKISNMTADEIRNELASRNCGKKTGVIYHINRKYGSNYSIRKTMLPLQECSETVDPTEKSKTTVKKIITKCDWKFNFDTDICDRK